MKLRPLFSLVNFVEGVKNICVYFSFQPLIPFLISSSSTSFPESTAFPIRPQTTFPSVELKTALKIKKSMICSSIYRSLFYLTLFSYYLAFCLASILDYKCSKIFLFLRFPSTLSFPDLSYLLHLLCQFLLF